MRTHELSLDGPGLEPYVALILRDYAPSEYVEHIYTGGMLPSAAYYLPLIGAAKVFRAAASLDDPEDVDASLLLMGKGKSLLRDAVGMMLTGRECACCIALRTRLESRRKGNGELWNPI